MFEAGNQRFRKLVDHSAPLYDAAKTKLEKTQVIASVVDKVRRDSPGGGFVKRDFQTGLWFEIGDDKARDKVGHAIRRSIEENKKRKSKFKEAAGRRSTDDEKSVVSDSSADSKLAVDSLKIFKFEESRPSQMDLQLPATANGQRAGTARSSQTPSDHSELSATSKLYSAIQAEQDVRPISTAVMGNNLSLGSNDITFNYGNHPNFGDHLLGSTDPLLPGVFPSQNAMTSHGIDHRLSEKTDSMKHSLDTMFNLHQSQNQQMNSAAHATGLQLDSGISSSFGGMAGNSIQNHSQVGGADFLLGYGGAGGPGDTFAANQVFTSQGALLGGLNPSTFDFSRLFTQSGRDEEDNSKMGKLFGRDSRF